MNLNSEPRTDVLVVSPHTDDAEIGLGGTIRLLADRGRSVWALDLTRGELATNATPDERWGEAGEASAILGLKGRRQLELPDGFIDAGSPEQVEQVGAVVRRLRPRWVITAPDAHRHPDHLAAPALVEKAVFLSRLEAWRPSPGPGRDWSDGMTLPAVDGSWAVEAVFGVCTDVEAPTVIFDVTETWEAKTRSLACYASQFAQTEGRKPTMINDTAFLERIERRARNWGHRAGVTYGEALRTRSVPVLKDLPDESWGGP